MTVLVTPEEMRAAEQALFDAGMPPPTLMRVAAERMAIWLDQHISGPIRRRAIALVGPGNNGGDALVTLALLIERGWEAGAVLLGREHVGELPAAAASLAEIDRCDLDALDSAHVILDGVFGIGGRDALDPEVVTAFKAAARARVRHGTALVALDVPSGIDSATGCAHPEAFRADVTLCLGLPKLGLFREPAATCVGELVLIDIGIAEPVLPERPRMIDERRVRELLPRRRASAHKHATGALVVIGGAPTYYGAPRLTGEAALRAGAGLVCLAVPEELAPVIAAQVPELIFLPLRNDGEAASRDIGAFVDQRRRSLTAAAIGPGLGRSATVDRMLDDLLDTGDAASDVLANVPLVIDADGLNWLAQREPRPRRLKPGRAVLTPHPGEMARLLRIDTDEVLAEPIEIARRAARRFQQVVVLKTGYAPVAEPDGSVWVSPRATPELATAGTGDVLTGITAGLLTQGLAPADAAHVGVFIGARAGRAARNRHGVRGVVASDVIREVATVLRTLEESPMISWESAYVREDTGWKLNRA
jgi:NAD(P)H-hydrate epimerase